MTRINTNVSSLVGRNNLSRANSSLSQSLTRLSTGLKINTGKDDPAGLIASENLRSDITSIRRAIGNTDRANQVIATADSALGQVSSLLNDIRGLITESANNGALSQDQIDANQAQIDSSLTALNRIAQTTTFQGRKLLDGSLNFITSAGTNFSRLTDLQIDEANLGSTGSVSVDVAITTAATKAQVDITNIPAATGAVNAAATFNLTNAIAQASGTVALDSQAQGTVTLSGQTFNLSALVGGNAAGAEGNAVTTLAVTFGAGSAATSYTAASNTLNVSVTQADGVATISDIIAAINGGSDFDAALGSAVGSTTVSAAQATAATFSLTGGDATISIAADASGAADGAEGNAVANLSVTFGAGSASTSYNATTNTLNVSLTQASDVATLGNLVTAVNAGSDFTLNLAGANTNATIGTGAAGVFSLTGGRDAGSTTVQVVADEAGVNNATVTIAESSTITNNTAEASIVGGNIQVAVRGTVTKAAIVSAINGLTGYSASVTATTGDSNYIETSDSPPAVATLAGGVAGAGGLAQDAVLQIVGFDGSDVFEFEAGSSIQQLADAINLVKDATGVEATVNSTTLELTSTAYGTEAFVDVKLIAEAAGGTIRAAIDEGDRDEGADIVATVNGINAKGRGNTLSVNTATLDVTASVQADYTGTIEFSITGGGALFQLGPDVVSNQQARLGITGVNTGQLGGVAGKLYELQNGRAADLKNDPTRAASIIEEAINQVTTLRGRLGAFQRTTLETNKNALNDTLSNLTEAESSIRDADFAEETANLTRAQILVQSGTRVLAIANQNPQNVLALLG